MVKLIKLAPFFFLLAACRPAVSELTEARFRQTIFNYRHLDSWQPHNNHPVVLLFSAAWHPAHNQLLTNLNKAAANYSAYSFYTVNIDNERQLLALFNIEVIPTFIFITSDGRLYNFSGLLTYDELNEVLAAIDE
ncbi:MAG: thioredoxin domain-containing protein [Spirochaetaceae bacterium]|nr:thioredoxin domain-containing protein [Spirochaetaceae bacterium]